MKWMTNQQPIVELPPACEDAQLLSHFTVEHSSYFPTVDVMTTQHVIFKLIKMYFANINKHHLFC